MGTPRRGTDAAGQLVWYWESEAFGEEVVSGTTTVNLRFPGQYFDQETSLHYNYFRYYDPSTGRFLRSDPIGLRGGLNTYAYVLNSPLKYSEPFGLAIPSFPDMHGFPPNEGMGPPLRYYNEDEANKEAMERFKFLAELAVGGAAIKGTLVCGKLIIKHKKKLQQACIGLGLGVAVCRGEGLDNFLRDLLRRQEIRQSSNQPTTTIHQPVSPRPPIGRP